MEINVGQKERWKHFYNILEYKTILDSRPISYEEVNFELILSVSMIYHQYHHFDRHAQYVMYSMIKKAISLWSAADPQLLHMKPQNYLC